MCSIRGWEIIYVPFCGRDGDGRLENFERSGSAGESGGRGRREEDVSMATWSVAETRAPDDRNF